MLFIDFYLFAYQTIPFIYVLMSRKTERCYTHIFQSLRDSFPLNGKSIMTDFETAMRNALRNVYPNIELNTCWFHFCQAAKRKASQLQNFSNAVKTNEEIKSAYYKLLALPLLPANDIIPTFQVVKSQVTGLPVVKDFFNYFEKQWLKKVYYHVSFILY